MMRFRIAYLLASLLCTTAVFAVTDTVPHASPDGKFLIVNIGDTAQPEYYFELRGSDGHVILSFKSLPDSDPTSFAEDITWSPRGDFVAVSISTGKYLRDTLVIATVSGAMIRVPTRDSDYQTRPVRWTRRGELIVETKASFGGKSDDANAWDSYQYRRTLRIRGGGNQVECVYTGSTIYPYRAEPIRNGYKPRLDTRKRETRAPITGHQGRK
jgi:hypothetical protein